MLKDVSFLYIFLLLLLGVAIIMMEVPGMLKEKLWKEMVLFFVILGCGLFLSIGQILEIAIPNPTDIIRSIFGP